MIAFRALNVVIACMMMLMIRSESHIPDVMFEVLKNGGFRVYTPAPDETYFTITINVNIPLTLNAHEDVSCFTMTHHNGYFMVESKRRMNKDDELYYNAQLHVKVSEVQFTAQVKESSWKVRDLLDSYSMLTDIHGEECIDYLLYDAFDGVTINTDNWIVEHKIPTYTGPRFVFNSYINSPETVFTKNHRLYLQPLALTKENDVRGTLNLGSSCTSSFLDECVYSQMSTFLLPPVKSAMLRSRRKFRYGKFEINAKLPVGDWIFPIIQLARPRPTIDHVSVDELWIAFSRGNQVHLGTNINGDLKTQVVFAGPVDNADEPLRSKKLVYYNTTSLFSYYFHTFELRWYPDKLQFFVDNEPFGELNSDLGSFGTSGDNLEYELQIGVGIGGLIDFPDGVNNKPWNNNERNYMKKFFEDKVNWLKTWYELATALKVDFVRVTAL